MCMSCILCIIAQIYTNFKKDYDDKILENSAFHQEL